MAKTLYAYIMTADKGFAPNPHGGLLTLGCCKPYIRCRAKKDDWIVGIGGKNLEEKSGKKVEEKLIYAAEITAVMPWKNYAGDPNHIKRDDNIYKFDGKNWHTLPNSFHNKPEQRIRDVERGKNVLISEHFWYFGQNAVGFPPELAEFATLFRKPVKNNHVRVSFEQGNQYYGGVAEKFVKWLKTDHNKPGVHGKPTQPLTNSEGGNTATAKKCGPG